MESPETKEQNRAIIEMVRQWGEVNSNGVLDPSCHYFSIPEVNGFIGYRIHSKNAIVIGDPVCSPIDKAALALAFQTACARNKLRVVYAIATETFTKWARKHLKAVSIEVLEKFVLDPFQNPKNNTGSHGGLVRKKLRHALKENVVVHEYTEDDPTTEHELEQVAHSWLASRKGPQIYLTSTHVFKHRLGTRWFYAQQGDKKVGLLLINQLQSHQGWLLNHVMFTKDAPQGTSELLVIGYKMVLCTTR